MIGIGDYVPSALSDCRSPRPGCPVVHLSYAQSLDGRIATASGDSRGLSSPESLELTHHIRAESDAILVGIGTVLADDPMLTCRLAQGCPSQPLRVILDSRLRIPLECRIVRTAREFPTLVVHGEELIRQAGFSQKRQALLDAGLEIIAVQSGPSGIDLPEMLGKLSEQGNKLVFVEGGSAVLTAFIAQDLADLMTVCLAPRLIGRGIESMNDLAVGLLAAAPRLEALWYKAYGTDLVWRLRPLAQDRSQIRIR